MKIKRLVPCRTCSGAGYIIKEYDRPGGRPGRQQVPCPDCKVAESPDPGYIWKEFEVHEKCQNCAFMTNNSDYGYCYMWSDDFRVNTCNYKKEFVKCVDSYSVL